MDYTSIDIIRGSTKSAVLTTLNSNTPIKVETLECAPRLIGYITKVTQLNFGPKYMYARFNNMHGHLNQ